MPEPSDLVAEGGRRLTEQLKGLAYGEVSMVVRVRGGRVTLCEVSRTESLHPQEEPGAGPSRGRQ